MLVGGVATAAVVLAAWFPVGALLNQRAQISAASAHLSQLVAQGRDLRAESNKLATPAVLSQLERADYQLVEPGQRLIQVLTPSGKPSARSDGAPYPGDPGFSAPVVPGGATIAPLGSGGVSSQGATAPRHASAQGFLSRVVATLEFWR